MQHISLLCIGKLKESFWRDAAAEYQKRLSTACKLTITELPEARCPDNPNQAQIEQTLQKEGAAILSHIPPQSYVIACCIEGKEMDSAAFSKLLEEQSLHGGSHISIIIGGSFGLSEEVKRRANLKLSFSPMTFPHMLARVMVLEQLYRAYQISSGTKYHK